MSEILRSLTEEFSVVSMLEPKDYANNDTDTESIDMSEIEHVSLVVTHAAITGDDQTLKLYAGATSGTKTTEIPFHYRFAGADFKATGNDGFGDRTAVAAGGDGLKMAAATYDHRAVVIELDAREMPEGLNWLTAASAHGSASANNLSIVAIGAPRYPKHNLPTVVA